MISYRMNRRQKERYKTWSKYLKSIDVYKDQDFFLENFNKIDFSFTTRIEKKANVLSLAVR